MKTGLCSLKTRLCTQLRDRPIHQCHNLLLSSACSLIKTQFEVITCVHEGIAPPCRHPDMSPRRFPRVFSPLPSSPPIFSFTLSVFSEFRPPSPLHLILKVVEPEVLYEIIHIICVLKCKRSPRPLKQDKIPSQSS